MKKIALGILIGVTILAVGGIVIAGKPDSAPGNSSPEKGQVVLPEHAVEVAPGVFYLGEAVDKGKVVEGYAFVRYKKGFGKPPWAGGPGGPGGGETDTSSCYGFLSKGAKWKTVEPYLVDPTNRRGLDGSFIRNNMALDISKWEDAADGAVDGNITKDILGDEIPRIVDGADLVSPDDKNEVYFGDVGQSGAIAVTIIWGIFSGPPWQRELVEWDQVYDQVDFDWSADCESEDCADKMDFENIATHELGHSVGLDDLYKEKCSEQTMYGYAGYGETKKRDLEAGDITGIQELYGE